MAPCFYRIGKYCDKIISNSSQTKQEIIDYLGVPEDKIAVINLGVDDRFHPIKKDKRDIYRIGYIGSISPRKRVDYLISAFSNFKKTYNKLNVKLYICGKKNMYTSQMQKMVDDLNLTNDVVFEGFVSDDTLNETYNSFDIVVIPSEWEGFGIPILEAQRCGIPVITRENVHIPKEVTQHSVKCESEKDMADKIYALLSDSKLYRKVSDDGIKYSKTFSWDNMVRKTIDIYKEVL